MSLKDTMKYIEKNKLSYLQKMKAAEKMTPNVQVQDQPKLRAAKLEN